MSEVASTVILWSPKDKMSLMLGLAIAAVILAGCSGDFDQAAFAPNAISLQPSQAPPALTAAAEAPAPRQAEPVWGPA